jgi:hypothetical protein
MGHPAGLEPATSRLTDEVTAIFTTERAKKGAGEQSLPRRCFRTGDARSPRGQPPSATRRNGQFHHQPSQSGYFNFQGNWRTRCPPSCGRIVLSEVTVLFTTWKRAPQIAAKCKTYCVAALWNMARRHSEPLKVRPAIGVRLAPRSLRSGPALRGARVSARAPGSGSPFRRAPEHFQTNVRGRQQKTLRSAGSGGSVFGGLSISPRRDRSHEQGMRR